MHASIPLGTLPCRATGGTKRRVWRKIHLGIDEQTLQVRAVEVTGSNIGDPPMLPELLNQIPGNQQIGSVTAPSRQISFRNRLPGNGRCRRHTQMPRCYPLPGSACLHAREGRTAERLRSSLRAGTPSHGSQAPMAPSPGTMRLGKGSPIHQPICTTESLGLHDLAGGVLRDAHTGLNRLHSLVGLLRQSVFGRLAGYEDVNDADRLARDLVMR